MEFKNLIGKELLYFDGGLGSLLIEKGLKPHEAPEEWNITHAEDIINIHLEYLEAGADIISANTFGANPAKLSQYGLETADIIKAAYENAKTAIEKFGGEKRFIALDMGPTGRLLEPLGDFPFEDAVKAFSETVKAAEGLGFDLILAETMNDSLETKAAVIAAKENSDLPVIASNVYDEKMRLLTGASPLEEVALLEGLGVCAIGANCSLGPDKMLGVLAELKKYSSLPLLVMPNAGLPRDENGKTVFDVSAEEFSDYAVKMAEGGAAVIGGCCGTTPEYIRKIVLKTKGIKPILPEKKNLTFVSSYERTAVFSKRPLLIGERINPTGKKRLKEALKNENYDVILEEAVKQQEFGAHILDVNAGLAEIDEKEVLKTLIKRLQAITPLPLQIDTSSYDAMEAAARVYNGKPLLNSVNGKKESMEKIFPVAKKYGGAIIALTLDESGIPNTAEGRFEIALKIAKNAEKFGIEKKELIFDPLAMAVSADKDAAGVTLETVKMLSQTGFKTSLGISNVSFGLPKRDAINGAFFSSAIACGLSCAIINPFSEEIMKAYYAASALIGADSDFKEYIEYFADRETESKAAAKDSADLKGAVLRGLKSEAKTAAEELLKVKEPMDIINGFIVPALNEVGKGFEEGKVFLPQLLMSAAAAQTAFDSVRSFMPEKKGGEDEKIVIATVYGDIHDIGKNIVRALLENYGFSVLDLGKNVPKEEILAAVKRSGARLLGLSALMTTTAREMAEAVRFVKESVPGIKVVVGGAVITEDYAKKIDADCYAADAMETVRYAEKILRNK